ncbi:MAG: tyrosine-type recombinase/integrase [Candidatus Electronema sp. V4]|uniref:tyrosine-type recombinase/integrase n=1 Tax=Candidatus Electronema sp. V4 TaxID=3454756 RepID=UPI00405575A2
MAANYLVRKGDTYYFRHYIPAAAQHLGKKELIKTLKVSRKSEAVSLSRELKIIFDLIMKKTEKNPAITWQEIRQYVDQAFDIIYERYVQSIETYGPDYNDEYDNPLNFIPQEYEQYLTLEDSTADWKNIPELQELADKIIQGKRLHISKNSKEYNLFCYRTAQMLMRHEAMKGGFCYQKHAGENNYSGSSVNEEKQVVVNTKEKQHLLINVFERYCEENQTSWSEDTRKEYEGNFQNIFSLLEIATEKKISDIYTDDITIDSINKFFSDLKHLPYNFTKRFKDKMLLAEAIDISRMASKGKHVDVDEKTLNYIMQKNKPTTLNRKYISQLRNLLDYACDCKYLNANPISKSRIIPSPKTGSNRGFRPFHYSELEKIFSHEIFSKKEIKHRKHEYKAFPYFKYWIPILALYSGARETEIAQLRLSDIKIKNDIYYFHVMKSDETTIKTDSSERFVPLHPKVIELGFKKYFEWLKNNGEKYLFPELEGVPTKKGAPVSKWFTRFIKLDCNILNESEISRVSFHSFRDNFSDEYKQKSVPEHIAAGTLGHKNKNVTYGTYGSDIHLDVKYENLVKYVDYSGCKFPWNNEEYFQTEKFPWEI